jgi:thiol-disulfide isomerase/thioredoxin
MDTKPAYKSLKQNLVVIGKITAEWCGYCKSLAEDWNVMSREFANNSIVKVINIDSLTEDKSIAEVNRKYLDVSSQKLVRNYYPTIFVIKNRKLSFYEGGRTSTELIAEVNKALENSMGHNKTVGGKRKFRKSRKSATRRRRRRSRTIRKSLGKS